MATTTVSCTQSWTSRKTDVTRASTPGMAPNPQNAEYLIHLVGCSAQLLFMEVYHPCEHYLSEVLRKSGWGPLLEDNRAKHYVFKVFRYLTLKLRDRDTVCVYVNKRFRSEKG